MSAKDIIVKPISSQDAARIVKSCHYSGKVVQNSQLHFGVFLDGKCGGAMQFGPSFDKRKIQGLVENTGWNGFLELNRMAFADWLPRNSESRAIAVAMRLIRKTYPHIEWVVSFADGTQCGDGTIYRASGFVLTGITNNSSIIELPSGEKVASMTFTKGTHILKQNGRAGIPEGSRRLPGFQLRYIYFLNPAAKSRLTVPILPFSEIERRGAGMYLGKPKRASSESSDTSAFHAGKGGATPTDALQSDDL
jgi:hypothetical protein